MSASGLAIPGRLNVAIAVLQVCGLGGLLWAAGRLGLGWCVLVLAPLWGIVMNATYPLPSSFIERTLSTIVRAVN